MSVMARNRFAALSQFWSTWPVVERQRHLSTYRRMSESLERLQYNDQIYATAFAWATLSAILSGG